MTATSSEDGLPIVDLRFESLRNLQEELGPYLAQEGLFLRGETDVGPSDVVRFRMMLPGDFVLVEGAGVIIWVRNEDEAGPLDPAGAAMGFATLSEQGRELVEQMVQTHIEGGGRPFDLSRPAAAEEAPDGGGGEVPVNTKLAGARLTVRGEPDDASQPDADEAGKAVAAAVAGPEETEGREEALSLPFADDPIEQPAEDPDEVVIETAVEELTLAEFGESILESGSDGDDAEPETAEELPESEAAEPAIELDAAEPYAEVGGGRDDDSVEDWQRLEEILEPQGPEFAVAEEEVAPEDAAAVLDPVLEAAEEYADRDPGESGSEDEADPGPAFGGNFEDHPGGYLEDSLLITAEEAAKANSIKRILFLGLAVVVVAAGAWLVWAYLSGAWPVSGGLDRPPVVASQEGEAQSEVPGEISDAELEAVVSAAVDAVVHETEAETSDPEPSASSGEEVDDGDAGGSEAEAVSSAPASVIEEIRWEPRAEGTVIVIRADGPLHTKRVRAEPLSSPPRVLIRIQGIVEAYRPLEIAVGSNDVRSVRMGHHPEKTPPSLWVVLDATGPDVTVKGVEVEGDTARILVGS